MKVIVGLGNPGEKYKNNRHSVGFQFIDELAKLNLPDIVLAKPQKFMNRSGQEVKRWLKNLQEPFLQNLYVAHDDLDIPLGMFKISRKGPLAHNGLNSIYEQLGTKDFWHIRIGIDAHRQGKTPEEFVLSNWRPEEKKIIQKVCQEIIRLNPWGNC